MTSTEENIEFLLPFYINGTLDAEENKRVEDALAIDENLREELVFLKGLQAQVQQQSVQPPGELGLKRLQKLLKQQQANDAVLPLKNAFSAKKYGWQMVAMAACLVLVVQTVVMHSPDSDEYMAAGGSVIVQHQGKIVSVTFAPNVTEQQIRRLLLETNASIVDGPSALGIYRLSVSNNIESTIHQFRTQTDLIESVQVE